MYSRLALEETLIQAISRYKRSVFQSRSNFAHIISFRYKQLFDISDPLNGPKRLLITRVYCSLTFLQGVIYMSRQGPWEGVVKLNNPTGPHQILIPSRECINRAVHGDTVAGKQARTHLSKPQLVWFFEATCAFYSLAPKTQANFQKQGYSIVHSTRLPLHCINLF